MASHNAPDLNTKPQHMGEFGNVVVGVGSVTPTAGALADVYRPIAIPGGWLVTDVDILFPDMDTGGSAFAVKIGYEPVNSADGPVADDDYFSVANTFLTGTAGRRQLVFKPIKFERPVYLTMTVTVAATTFVSGELTAIVKGDGVGIK
jgi:hypothetical protein